MSESEFNLDMEELVSAEDFLDYFGISYDPAIVHVNRLHILQRFHDYLDKEPALPALTAMESEAKAVSPR
ncbi:MAG: hypothetical protein G8D60_10965 [gamma proteobacterium symbiont of Phacoides pectinatus]